MLDRLEKKYGRYAVKNLIYYILGAYVIGYILVMAKPEWYSALVLDPVLVMQGQVWRLFTWVCSIPQSINFFLIFMFLFYYFIGRTLEQYMGAFRYNLYIFSGWFFTTLGVMAVYWISSAISGPAGAVIISANTNYLNLTSFLAFALIFPDTKVMFFAIIPVKMKILAWIDGIYLGLQVLSGLVITLASAETVASALSIYTGSKASALEVAFMKQESLSLVVTILISFVNFFIFFLANARKRADNKKRREEFQKKASQGAYGSYSSEAGDASRVNRVNGQTAGGFGAGTSSSSGSRFNADASGVIVHKCDVCGRTNISNPELSFRFCSKCEGNHEYCQDHLFTHVHVK